jgi:hypothetical protein
VFLPFVAVSVGALLVGVHARAGEQQEPKENARRTQGPLIQLRSAVDTPVGGALPLPMRRLDRVIGTELIPIRLDFGYRLPHLYAGVFGQKSHGTTQNARLTSADGAASGGAASSYELGATVEYHFTTTALIDPWIGIYGARRSIWLSNSSANGVRFRGPEGGLTAGIDIRVARPLLLGVFVSAGYSSLGVSFTDDSHPIDAHAKVTWLGLGLRISSIL